MKKLISIILALSTSMTLLCCNAFADNTINYNTVTDQLYSGFTDEIYKTTAFGGSSLKSDAVVTSTQQLNDYMSLFYDSDTTNSYVNKYNDAFFENNVLFLNSLYQGGGTAPCYEVKDVALSNSRYTVYGQWDYPEIVADVLSVLLVQISVPINVYNAHPYEVVWTEKPDNKPYYTTEIKDIGYIPNVHNIPPATITNKSELVNYLSSFNENLQNEYTQKYDDNFFENNVIFINTFYQPHGAVPYLKINIFYKDDTQNKYIAKYMWNLPKGTGLVTECRDLLALIIIDKDNYDGSECKWNEVDYTYTDYSAVISSQQDYRNYLSKFYSDEELDRYAKEYNENFFDDNVLLANAVFYDTGDNVPMYSGEPEIDLSDNTYHINLPLFFSGMMNNDEPYYAIYRVTIPKSDYSGQKLDWIFSEGLTLFRGECVKIDQFFSEYTDEVFTKQDHCAVVTDIKQLKDYLSKYYNSEVVDRYCNKYNNEFFENNFVILNSFTQGAGLKPLFEINSFDEITPPDNSYFVKHYNVEGNMINPDYPLPDVISVLLVQIPLAKGAYNPNLPINWNISTVNVKTDPNSDTDTGKKDYPAVYGDIDNDGKVSMRDSLKIMRSCIGLEKLGNTAMACADVNGDGKVSAADSLEIQRYCIHAKANAKIGTDCII